MPRAILAGVGADTAELYFALLEDHHRGSISPSSSGPCYCDSGGQPLTSALEQRTLPQCGAAPHRGEQNMLTGSDFLRAQVAYVSLLPLTPKPRRADLLQAHRRRPDAAPWRSATP